MKNGGKTERETLTSPERATTARQSHLTCERVRNRPQIEEQTIHNNILLLTREPPTRPVRTRVVPQSGPPEWSPGVVSQSGMNYSACYYYACCQPLFGDILGSNRPRAPLSPTPGGRACHERWLLWTWSHFCLRCARVFRGSITHSHDPCQPGHRTAPSPEVAGCSCDPLLFGGEAKGTDHRHDEGGGTT